MSAKLKNDTSKKRHLNRKLVCESLKLTVSPFTCSFGCAKNFLRRVVAFESELLMNGLKCQIGVALILKCF